jgi:F-box protein 9
MSASELAFGAPPSSNYDDENSTVWFREDERWELTWPIWHMLSRAERKDFALQHGYKTIGEFEEYMTLQRAVGDSTERPDENDKAFSSIGTTEQSGGQQPLHSIQDDDRKRAFGASRQADGDDDDSACDDERLEQEDRLTGEQQLPNDLLLARGGQILRLPDEMLHRIFEWLPVDAYATLAAVSPHWKSFTRTEAVYKRLCERLYLNQSARRALHVSRFDNSYRCMLEKRPRVRAGGGVYVLKYARVKQIQRDMWTEVRVS